MRRANQTRNDHPAALSDQAIWRYCQAIDATPDEPTRLLDLAGFADARLDADEHERIAALLASDPDAVADVAAAKALATLPATVISEQIVQRAIVLGDACEPARGRLIPFTRVSRPSVYGVARWGSLAAAVVVVGWLGFALGSNASLVFGQTMASATGSENFLGDLLDPAGGLLTNLSSGLES